MSKRFISYKKDDLLEKIYAAARSSENPVSRRDCNDMVLYFVRNGYMPTAMKKRAREIVGMEPVEQEKPVAQERRYLYAIQGDDRVKIGYSSKPKARLKSLQTASTDTLKLVWQTYVGDDDVAAKKQEKKLHRMISHFRIRGEWFKPQCLIVVKGFRVRNDYTKQEAIADETHIALDSEFSAIMDNL